MNKKSAKKLTDLNPPLGFCCAHSRPKGDIKKPAYRGIFGEPNQETRGKSKLPPITNNTKKAASARQIGVVSSNARAPLRDENPSPIGYSSFLDAASTEMKFCYIGKGDKGKKVRSVTHLVPKCNSNERSSKKESASTSKKESALTNYKR